MRLFQGGHTAQTKRSLNVWLLGAPCEIVFMQRQRIKDLLLRVRALFRTSKRIIFPHSCNQIIDLRVLPLHTRQWKTIVLHALHMQFSFFGHFGEIVVLSMTWNDLFCSCVDDVSIWWQMFNFVFLSLKRRFQFSSRRVRLYFASVMTLNKWKRIAETRSYIFRWRIAAVDVVSYFLNFLLIV